MICTKCKIDQDKEQFYPHEVIEETSQGNQVGVRLVMQNTLNQKNLKRIKENADKI